MKIKKFLLAATALLAVAGASAQKSTYSNNKAFFGARLSLDITCPGEAKDDHVSIDAFKSGVGVDGGVIYNIPFYRNFYFEPGLSLYYNTTGLDKDVFEVDGSLREFGFRVPFKFGYRFDFRPCSLFVFTGPEFECGLSGKIHAKSGKVSESTDMYDYFNRASLGWLFGAGLSVDNFYVQLEQKIGVTDRMKDDGTWRNGRFSLSIGYNFK